MLLLKFYKNNQKLFQDAYCQIFLRSIFTFEEVKSPENAPVISIMLLVNI